MKVGVREIRLRGVPVCDGIAIGEPYHYCCLEREVARREINDVDKEIERYREGLRLSRGELSELKSQLEAEGVLEGAAILSAHLQILRDAQLTSAIEQKVRDERCNCEWLFQRAIAQYEVQFSRIADPFFRERVKDLKDIARRVLSRLCEEERPSLAGAPRHCIVFAEDLVPSDAAEAESARIAAFVTRAGGDTSHAAIMAKARGIPYVASVAFDGVEDWQSSAVIVDGRRGEVILHPEPATLDRYRGHRARVILAQETAWLEEGEIAETIDGYPVAVSANVEMVKDAQLLPKMGSNGIGLFRTEYLCLSRGAFPSEEEQFSIYKAVAEKMEGRPVVIRTFDVGGDKVRDLPRLQAEANPFLGCRAIRFMLREKEAFRNQIRAILRASVHGNLRLLLPMITSVTELREAKEHIERVAEELDHAGVPYNRELPVGCMIEVPSAAIMTDVLAPECDFFSIGTNDLIQYALAVDRGNQLMRYLYTPAHPSIMRLIHLISKNAARSRIPVTLCGEVAADPRFTPLLVGLGISELSMATRYIPVVQQMVRRFDVLGAHQLAEEVLRMTTPQEILDRLEEEYRRLTLGRVQP